MGMSCHFSARQGMGWMTLFSLAWRAQERSTDTDVELV